MPSPPAFVSDALERMRRATPVGQFHSFDYMRHTQRRQEHLASLALPLKNRTVLELGAGIGDHTTFFLDRGCSVTITEPREANLRVLRRRYADADIRALDVDNPDPGFTGRWNIVYSYGLLYHLSRPAAALAFSARACEELLLLETCVTPGDDVQVHMETERARNLSQAKSGMGCRPTRPWVFQQLAKHFEHVYTTRTQPWHDQFPLDWSIRPDPSRLTRAVFVGSREPLESPFLVSELPDTQFRH